MHLINPHHTNPNILKQLANHLLHDRHSISSWSQKIRSNKFSSLFCMTVCRKADVLLHISSQCHGGQNNDRARSNIVPIENDLDLVNWYWPDRRDFDHKQLSGRAQSPIQWSTHAHRKWWYSWYLPLISVLRSGSVVLSNAHRKTDRSRISRSEPMTRAWAFSLNDHPVLDTRGNSNHW